MYVIFRAGLQIQWEFAGRENSNIFDDVFMLQIQQKLGYGVHPDFCQLFVTVDPHSSHVSYAPKVSFHAIRAVQHQAQGDLLDVDDSLYSMYRNH